MLNELILANLKREGLLNNNRPFHLVVAYSGGIDSSVLLHAVASLRQHPSLDFPLTVTAAYVHHGWRGQRPPELELVMQVTRDWQVPLVLVTPDNTLAHKEHVAREFRYAKLAQLVADLDADALLTAHHADDQVETILFRLFRGTGTDGLAGIPERRQLKVSGGKTVPVLRPMLDLYRDGIRRYAEERQLRWFNDPSNKSLKHQRNMLRHELIPHIQHHFPQLKHAMLKLAEIVHHDKALIDESFVPVWQRIYQSGGLDTLYFNQLDRPFQLRVAKHFLEMHHQEVGYEKIEELIEFIQGTNRRVPNSARLKSINTLPNGQRQFFYLFKNRLTIVTPNPSPGQQGTPIPPGGTTPMLIPIPGEAHYFRFRAKLKVSPVAEEQPSLPKLELLDKTEKLEPLPAISLTPPAQPSQPPASESAAQPTESEPGNAEAVQQPTAENGQETQPEQTEPAHQLIEAPQATEAPQAIEEHAPTPVIDPVDPGPPGPAPVRVETILADLSEFEGCKLELRSRQPGDRIQLPGMAYPVRLKKLMIERGIPRFERDQIPVIAVGRDVLWAVGLDVSTHVRPKAKPTHRIELEFYP